MQQRVLEEDDDDDNRPHTHHLVRSVYGVRVTRKKSSSKWPKNGQEWLKFLCPPSLLLGSCVLLYPYLLAVGCHGRSHY